MSSPPPRHDLGSSLGGDLSIEGVKMNQIRFIDLFAGMSGIRIGFESACVNHGYIPNCVFTSEIKAAAIEMHKENYPNETIIGDITQVNALEIPDHDFLLAGFPCQAFSAAGKRLGFMDTRGTLFFDVERIILAKKPFGFVLENVEGLVNHDKIDKKAKIGRTLETILRHLEDAGYKISWRVLNAKNFGVPQDRKRIYIVGTRIKHPDLLYFEPVGAVLGDILEHDLPTSNSAFVKKLLKHYTLAQLQGKAIKDKRGGENNIHSWDIEMKGPITLEQKQLLNKIMTERRKRKWADEYGIDWMDGMPLTLEMIESFYPADNLEAMLEDLVEKRYVVKEHPKRKDGQIRVPDKSLPLGYNIVAGKMSFEVSKVLNPDEIAPTLVAMDMQHLYVPDGDGIRPLSLREGLRLFGYPDTVKFNVSVSDGYNLLGNTVVVPVIAAVADRVLDIYDRRHEYEENT